MTRNQKFILYGVVGAVAYWLWKRNRDLYAVAPGAAAAASSGVTGLGDGGDITYRMGTGGDPMYGGPALYGIGDAEIPGGRMVDQDFDLVPTPPYRPYRVRYPVPVVRQNDDNWSS